MSASRVHKVRHCWGLSCGQNLFANFLYQQHLPHYLRDDKQFFIYHPGSIPITTSQGEELQKLINAPAYIECSSKTQQHVKAVFDEAIKVVLQPPKAKKKNSEGQKAYSIL